MFSILIRVHDVRTLVDPLAKKYGLNEDLNHLKPQLLSLQTRHYSHV